MLSHTASEVHGILAYLCWKENIIKFYYVLDNVNGFLAMNIILVC